MGLFGDICAFHTGFLPKFLTQMLLIPMVLLVLAIVWFIAENLGPKFCMKRFRFTTKESRTAQMFNVVFLTVGFNLFNLFLGSNTLLSTCTNITLFFSVLINNWYKYIVIFLYRRLLYYPFLRCASSFRHLLIPITQHGSHSTYGVLSVYYRYIPFIQIYLQ